VEITVIIPRKKIAVNQLYKKFSKFKMPYPKDFVRFFCGIFIGSPKEKGNVQKYKFYEND
jgi:hypothetical protein